MSRLIRTAENHASSLPFSGRRNSPDRDLFSTPDKFFTILFISADSIYITLYNLCHLTLRALEQALRQSVPEIHHSDQDIQYLSNVYLLTLAEHGVEISVAHRGCSGKNAYAELFSFDLCVKMRYNHHDED